MKKNVEKIYYIKKKLYLCTLFIYKENKISN